MAVALLLLGPATAPLRANEALPGLADRVAQLMPTVVNIETVAVTGGGRMFFFGSGVVVDPSGVIVTNRHVVQNAESIMVSGRSLQRMAAKPIYVGIELDIALLKVEAPAPLPVVTFGNSDTLRLADPVVVIGNPLGIGESVSAGIVSALNRNIRETPYDDFIQTDAAINHGNSGGAMFNMAGELVGITTALYSSDGNTGNIGLGFAMPANDAKFVIAQVLKTGQVRHGWAGVHLQGLTPDLAAAFGLPAMHGAIVSRVDPNGPAVGAIRVGDVLVKIGDQPETDIRALARQFAEASIGATLPVHLLRDGVAQTVAITIAEYPGDRDEAVRLKSQRAASPVAVATAAEPGMHLAALTPDLRARYKVDDGVTGVVVTDVQPGSAAAAQKIAAGDVVLQVRDAPVNSPEALTDRLRDLAARKVSYAALLVQSGRGTQWVALPLAAGP
jgi:serine protease Do